MSKFAYVGTYSAPNGVGNGIYIYQVDPSTGSLNFLETVPSASASFLCFNQKRDRLYAVNELNEYPGQNGDVTAFKVDSNTGKLTLLNKLSSLGTWPCHITLDPSGKFVIASNYGSGSVAVFSLKPDGSLDKSTDLVTNSGSGPNKDRQEGAHAHMFVFDHKGKQGILVDLGIDQTLFYKLDAGTGKLALQPGVSCDAHPGAGPRHVAESQDGRFYYIINELDATVSVYSSEKAGGKCPILQTISTLPKDAKFQDFFLCAEIALHPNGKFLYGSNRGHDSIAIFAVDGSTGLLTVVGHESTQGSFPRHFQINSNKMYVANQKSDNVVVFKIDPNSGKLNPTGEIVPVPSPVCIVFD